MRFIFNGPDQILSRRSDSCRNDTVIDSVFPANNEAALFQMLEQGLGGLRGNVTGTRELRSGASRRMMDCKENLQLRRRDSLGTQSFVHLGTKMEQDTLHIAQRLPLECKGLAIAVCLRPRFVGSVGHEISAS